MEISIPIRIIDKNIKNGIKNIVFKKIVTLGLWAYC